VDINDLIATAAGTPPWVLGQRVRCREPLSIEPRPGENYRTVPAGRVGRIVAVDDLNNPDSDVDLELEDPPGARARGVPGHWLTVELAPAASLPTDPAALWVVGRRVRSAVDLVLVTGHIVTAPSYGRVSAVVATPAGPRMTVVFDGYPDTTAVGVSTAHVSPVPDETPAAPAPAASPAPPPPWRAGHSFVLNSDLRLGGHRPAGTPGVIETVATEDAADGGLARVRLNGEPEVWVVHPSYLIWGPGPGQAAGWRCRTRAASINLGEGRIVAPGGAGVVVRGNTSVPSLVYVRFDAFPDAAEVCLAASSLEWLGPASAAVTPAGGALPPSGLPEALGRRIRTLLEVFAAPGWDRVVPGTLGRAAPRPDRPNEYACYFEGRRPDAPPTYLRGTAFAWAEPEPAPPPPPDPSTLKLSEGGLAAARALGETWVRLANAWRDPDLAASRERYDTAQQRALNIIEAAKVFLTTVGTNPAALVGTAGDRLSRYGRDLEVWLAEMVAAGSPAEQERRVSAAKAERISWAEKTAALLPVEVAAAEAMGLSLRVCRGDELRPRSRRLGPADTALVVTTPPVTLATTVDGKRREVALGAFELRLKVQLPHHLTNIIDHHEVIALEPHLPGGMTLEDDDGLYWPHPHIEGRTLCDGNQGQHALRHLRDFRLADALDVLYGLLTSYTPSSRYHPLEQWHIPPGAHSCVDCGAMVHGPTELVCVDCGDAFCGEHAARCQADGCGQPVCNDHAERCGDCEHVLCNDHAHGCTGCGRVCCTDCAAVCAACGQSVCEGCSRVCAGCGQTLCTAHRHERAADHAHFCSACRYRRCGLCDGRIDALADADAWAASACRACRPDGTAPPAAAPAVAIEALPGAPPGFGFVSALRPPIAATDPLNWLDDDEPEDDEEEEDEEPEYGDDEEESEEVDDFPDDFEDDEEDEEGDEGDVFGAALAGFANAAATAATAAAATDGPPAETTPETPHPEGRDDVPARDPAAPDHAGDAGAGDASGDAGAGLDVGADGD
jgi:hypothetical protein